MNKTTLIPASYVGATTIYDLEAMFNISYRGRYGELHEFKIRPHNNERHMLVLTVTDLPEESDLERYENYSPIFFSELYDAMDEENGARYLLWLKHFEMNGQWIEALDRSLVNIDKADFYAKYF